MGAVKFVGPAAAQEEGGVGSGGLAESRELKAKLKALGLSSKGSKTELQVRVCVCVCVFDRMRDADSRLAIEVGSSRLHLAAGLC
jgi:hypothetical protein